MTFPPYPTNRFDQFDACDAGQGTVGTSNCESQARMLHHLQELLRLAQEMLCDLQQQIEGNRR